MNAPHIPVLLNEVVQALAPSPGALIVDATFGAGGYTRSLLDAGATVHAFDRDPDAISAGQAWPEACEEPPRLVLHPRRFSEMVSALAERGISRVDGIAMDIGVSSMQLDQPLRGFAFAADGPLDMRMGQSGPTAADFVNTAAESEIADVLYRYGEERQSRRVARAIVAARPLATTGELARTVRKALGYRQGAPKDPATRTFQAIRIHVNAELEELHDGLFAAETLLKSGGRLAVVSFHSLEDRIVKRFMRDLARGPQLPRGLPVKAQDVEPPFRLVGKALKASEPEVRDNVRARSAVMRVLERRSDNRGETPE